MFSKLYANQFAEITKNPNATRSPYLIGPMHDAIAKFVENNSDFSTISFPKSEYEFITSQGTKKVDVAIFNKKNELVGAIMFKGIRSEYNKNANNYYEQMKGESSLFLEANIPVFQIVFIPTQIKHKDYKGRASFETPTEKSFNNYENFINGKSKYWEKLKLSVYYFDVDYTSFNASYSSKRISNVEETLEEGLINFIGGISNNQ